MTLEFWLLFDRLNLASLSQEKRDKVVEKCGLLTKKAVEIFEYKKNNDGYWDWANLLHQVVTKVLPIAKILYSGYSHLFLFDNTTSHSVYTKNALQAKDMKKDIRSQQAQLFNRCYNLNKVHII